jgi:hypothetical protein
VATCDVGHVGLFQDVDGTIRALPLMIDYHGRAWPSLSLILVSRYLGANWRDLRFTRGKAFLPYPGGELAIPVDRHGQVLINYPGSEKAFTPGAEKFITLLDELKLRDSLEFAGKPVPRGRLDRLTGKIVIVCNTATETAFSDFGQTPFAQTFPLAYAHAAVELAPARRLPGEGPARRPGGSGCCSPSLLVDRAGGAHPGRARADRAGRSFRCWWSLLMVNSAEPHRGCRRADDRDDLVRHLLRGYIIRDRQRRAQEQELAVARRIQQDLLPKSVLTVSNIEVLGRTSRASRSAATTSTTSTWPTAASRWPSPTSRERACPPRCSCRTCRRSCAPNAPAAPTCRRSRPRPTASSWNRSAATASSSRSSTARSTRSRAACRTRTPATTRRWSCARAARSRSSPREGSSSAFRWPSTTRCRRSRDRRPRRPSLMASPRLSPATASTATSAAGAGRARACCSAKEIAQAILDDVDRFSHGRHQTDDVTVVVKVA